MRHMHGLQWRAGPPRLNRHSGAWRIRDHGQRQSGGHTPLLCEASMITALFQALALAALSIAIGFPIMNWIITKLE
jgi:hypothetical protein